MNIHEVIRRPLVTEKSSIGRDEHNLATFAVDRTRYEAVRAERAKEREAVQAKLGGLQLPPNTVNSNVIIH